MNDNARPSRWFVFTLGMLAALTATAVDLSLPAIPMMVDGLSAEMSLGQQVVGLYIAGIAVGQLPAGLYSDRIGRLPVLYFGLGLFTIASIVSALAVDIHVMLIARFVQGIGGAAGIVLSRAIVRDVSSGPEAARLMSVMVMIFTIVPMLAPVVGSLVVATLGWRASFGTVAAFGLLAMYAVNRTMYETHVPVVTQGALRQLGYSLREFITQRQSLYGAALVVLAAVGYMSMISGSAALILEIYGFPVATFGFIFALQGAGLLIGSSLNRRLLLRYSAMQMLAVGATLTAAASVQMLIIMWLGDASFWWVWGNSCLFMTGSAFIMTNGTAIALDPVPRTAGVGSSVIGTLQGLASATSAVVAGALYDGSVSMSIVILGLAGIVIAAIFLSRRLILGNRPVTAHDA
jgi:DHA1 family bicyclomycin/chloramphenicol resistance-like MFS transporter